MIILRLYNNVNNYLITRKQVKCITAHTVWIYDYIKYVHWNTRYNSYVRRGKVM